MRLHNLLSADMQSADAIISHLLFISPTRKLLYATDVWSSTLQPVGNFQHLTCFLAGLFALGARTIPNVDPKHGWAAEGLAHSCWISYADSKTGLGPEVMSFRDEHMGKRWVEELTVWEKAGRPNGVPPGVNQTLPVKSDEDTEYVIADAQYILRPEVQHVLSRLVDCEADWNCGRPLRASTSSGRRLEIRNGRSAAGQFLKPSRSTLRTETRTRLY